MVSVPDLSELFKDARPISYRKNENILRAEDEPQGVYYIESGLVKAVSYNKLGESYIHLIYRAGEIFPFAWSLYQDATHANFVAHTDAKLRRMPRDRFNGLVTQGGTSTEIILQYLAQYLVTYMDRVQNLEYKYAGERVAYRLLFMASRFGETTPEGLLIDLPLTYEDLAASVNLSRKSVQRELEKLTRRDLVIIKNRRFVIPDPKLLADELVDMNNLERWGLA